jgi:hypothetical protein
MSLSSAVKPAIARANAADVQGDTQADTRGLEKTTRAIGGRGESRSR